MILEREQPNAMFTTTPLTFVPIGLLEKSEFFNIGNEMDPAKLRCDVQDLAT